ncbi:MAG: NAD(P)-dependent oxidoreductase [Legionellaceae bacterium]|nr:NAD(P)-dependent oxidoreductase [Legionellaceae bacterium]
MHILVLGGSGFLGQYIVKDLMSHPATVSVLTRDPTKLKGIFNHSISPFNRQTARPGAVHWIQGDLLDNPSLDLSAFSHIINCSGEIRNEAAMRHLHVHAVQQLLNQFQPVTNAHWIQISSVGVYGKQQSGILREQSPFTPIGEYETTKAESELLVQRFCREHALRYTIIRPSNVFGLGMPNQSLAQLLSMMRKKRFVYIGKKIDDIMMNYVPVEDVSRLILDCINHPAAVNQDFIVSDQLTLPDFVQTIARALNTTLRFPHLPEQLLRTLAKITRPFPTPLTEARIDALTTRAIYSSEKAKHTLGFTATVGIRKGLNTFCHHLFADRAPLSSPQP